MIPVMTTVMVKWLIFTLVLVPDCGFAEAGVMWVTPPSIRKKRPSAGGKILTVNNKNT